MIYCGIDPSITNTGVVLLSSNGTLLGTYNSKKSGIKKPAYPHEQSFYLARGKGIADFISGITGDEALAVVYEDYSYGSIHRGYSLAEYNGVLKAILFDRFNSLDFQLRSPTEVKKFATGNGSATKEMMMSQARKECPELNDATEDVCDAWFMGQMARYSKEPIKDLIATSTGVVNLRKRLEINQGG